jgi:Flp pilus assembly protein protease CpaA
LLATLGVWIAWVDIKERRIPHLLLASFLVASLISYIFQPRLFLASLATALVLAILIVPLSLIRSRVSRRGDSKLIIALALLLGRGERIIGALLAATFIGLVQISLLSIEIEGSLDLSHSRLH